MQVVFYMISSIDILMPWKCSLLPTLLIYLTSARLAVFQKLSNVVMLCFRQVLCFLILWLLKEPKIYITIRFGLPITVSS